MRRRKSGISKLQKKNRIVSALFLAPSLIGLLVFYVLPFGLVIQYSLVDNPIAKQFVFLDNYNALFQNASFQQSVGNTLLFSFTAVPLGVVGSLLLACALEQNIPWKGRFRTIFLSPMMVPVASIVLIWQVFFHQNGIINTLVASGTVKIDWLKSDYGQIVIVSLFVWKNLGYNMVLFMAALQSIPKDLLEVARIEGAGAWRIFFRIKLRYLSPTILFVTILSLISSFKIFREIYLLAGDYPYSSLYLMQHFMNNMFKSLDYPHISAAALLMLGFMILLIGTLFFAENRYGRDVEE